MDNSDKGVLLIGGGGHCKSVLCSLLTVGKYGRIGIVDPVAKGDLMGVPVVGKDEDLPRLRDTYDKAFITVGSQGNTCLRRHLHALAYAAGYTFVNIIDTTAVVSVHATLGQGIFVGKQAVINSGASVGNFAILNSGCIVEHESKIGSFAHVAPGVVLGGNVEVGEDVFIGLNASVLPGVCIGKGARIGAGSVVHRDIAADVLCYGNPCKEASK